MKKIDIANLIIENKKEDPNSLFSIYKVNAFYDGMEVASATYNKDKKGIVLGWIETYDDYKGNGIANKILDFLCNEALNANLFLTINVVDEDALGFYRVWFDKKTNLNAARKLNAAKRGFEQLVSRDDFSIKIILSPENIKSIMQPTNINRLYFK